MYFNVLSFEPLPETININLYTEKVEGFHPLSIYKDECSELWKNIPSTLTKYKSLFCSFSNEENECIGTKFTTEINLNKVPRVALHYFRYLLYKHFLNAADAVCNNYIDGVEVWVRAASQKDAEVNIYDKFTLNPQHARITNSFELLISYNGSSSVLNKPISQLSDIEPETFSLVIVNKELAKFHKLSTEQKQYIEETYPVLNFTLAKKVGKQKQTLLNPNKYISTLKYIQNFYKFYLSTPQFQKVLSLNANGFLSVPGNSIFKTSHNSNTLVFGNNRTNIAPFDGMKEGPFKAPTVSSNNVRFFFVFQKDTDLNNATILHSIFTQGLFKKGTDQQGNPTSFKAFKALSEYIKQPFHTDPKGSITFSSLENAVHEIKQALSKKELKPDCTYVAIYISPIKKDDIDNPYHDVYYKIKELLLEKGITSQVIHNERHNDEYFSFHLPNIAIAILAKLGGIPWRLNASAKNDLIIGVGAFRSTTIGQRYIGSAFCFNKEGIFQDFDCYRDNDLDHLIADIRKALMHYVVEYEKAERLIIHYYKTMRRKDSQRIVDMLHRLGLNIPVIVVSINKTESEDIVVFNTQVSDLMPLSGTFIKVNYNQFLLFNNAKYTEEYAKSKGKKDYPFPIKVKISSTDQNQNRMSNRHNTAN